MTEPKRVVPLVVLEETRAFSFASRRRFVRATQQRRQVGVDRRGELARGGLDALDRVRDHLAAHAPAPGLVQAQKAGGEVLRSRRRVRREIVKVVRVGVLVAVGVLVSFETRGDRVDRIRALRGAGPGGVGVRERRLQHLRGDHARDDRLRGRARGDEAGAVHRPSQL